MQSCTYKTAKAETATQRKLTYAEASCAIHNKLLYITAPLKAAHMCSFVQQRHTFTGGKGAGQAPAIA